MDSFKRLQHNKKISLQRIIMETILIDGVEFEYLLQGDILYISPVGKNSFFRYEMPENKTLNDLIKGI